MEYKITEGMVDSITEEVDELTELIEDRVKECYEVKGMQTERHALMLYRNILWKIKEKFNSNLEEIKST